MFNLSNNFAIIERTRSMVLAADSGVSSHNSPRLMFVDSRLQTLDTPCNGTVCRGQCVEGNNSCQHFTTPKPMIVVFAKSGEPICNTSRVGESNDLEYGEEKKIVMRKYFL